MRVVESNIPMLATIPVPNMAETLNAVARLRNHPGAAVFTSKTGNMDMMRETIYNQLCNLLQKR
ncbi:hypothetical protein PR202_gb18470 [Eleusine coracana subsp. coracana]|uniref:Uncharacterized protein n=1 Tax=Eleusine coracana subsp. coracana TaxID=191504 RepID=A0AAV5F5M8_ELECO|nr:hypothetical protein PR202_gb18470 [Eleusine coracana subsp. coracana]